MSVQKRTQQQQSKSTGLSEHDTSNNSIVTDESELETPTKASPTKRGRQEIPSFKTSNTSPRLIKTAIPSRSSKKRPRIVFGIPELLLNICNYCDIFDIIRWRRIDSNLNEQLAFLFDCQEYHVYFKSKRNIVQISQIIKNHICSDLSSLCRWYLMTENYRASKMLFLSQNETETEKGKTTTTQKHSQNEKGTWRKMHLFDVLINMRDQFDEIYEKNDEDANMPIEPLKQLFSQLEHIDNCLKIENWESNICRYIPDWLIMGEMFGIKPLKTKLVQLIKTRSFRMFLRYSKYNGYTRQTVWSSGYRDSTYTIYNCNLSFFWSNIHSHAANTKFSKHAINMCCFSYLDEDDHDSKVPKPRGKHAFFTDLACCGNFDYYKKFTRYNKPLHEIYNYQLKYGILVMIAAFLKLRLLKKFVVPHIEQIRPQFCGEEFESYCAEIMMFALNPNHVNTLKNTLTMPKYSLMRIGDKSSVSGNAFDIIGNATFYPNSRLRFMWHLCFSSMFASEFIQRVKYEEVRELVIDSYSNFDYFVKFWHLNEYKHLKNNKIKQENIHFKYKMILQYLFGLSGFYGNHFVTKALEKAENFDGYEDNCFIDIKPCDQDEVIVLYDILKQRYSEEEMLQSLIYPKVDTNPMYLGIYQEKEMQFDVVENVFQFIKGFFDVSFV